jgi:putative oxidoreductase
VRRLIEFAGRSMMAGTFVRLGWEAFREPGGRRAEQAARIGLPNAEALVRFNGGAMMLGGTAFAAGIFPRAAAVGLIVSLVPTTYAGHRFWEEQEPATRNQQRIHFLKNIAIVGGLLVYVGTSGRDRPSPTVG